MFRIMLSNLNRLGLSAVMLVLASAVFSFGIVTSSRPAIAHGERNQEPFLRMRTTHFYDVKFSVPDNSTLNVNDELTFTGRVRLFSFWPASVAEPGMIYMNAATAGAAFVKKESWVNKVPAIQSFEGELGRDYDFRVVLQARTPGQWHVHPMINVESAGGLLGPGIYVEIQGDQDDFAFPVTTLDGTQIANLATYGMGNVYFWHVVWAIIALAWIVWWIRRPLLIPRFLLSRTGEADDELVTRQDSIVAAAFMVLTIGLVTGSYFYSTAKYPNAIPLQAGTSFVNPLPVAPSIPVTVKAARLLCPWPDNLGRS